MPEIVTHEALRDGQHALNARFDRHEAHFNEVTTRLFDKVDKLTDATHDTGIAVADVYGRVNSILDARDGHMSRLSAVEASVRALHDNDTARMAERGVWAALARSPIIMALIGAMAGAAMAIWAVVKSVSAHVPMVMFALLVTASLAGAALA